MIITTHMIQALAIVTALIALSGVIVWRVIAKRKFIYVHWSMFVGMSLGAMVIWYFYTSIERAALSNGHIFDLVQFSRLLFVFILLITSLMGLGALVYWISNVKDDE